MVENGLTDAKTTLKKALGSTQNEPKTAPERSQSHHRQQEASQRRPREFQDEFGGPLWSIQRYAGVPKRPPRARQSSPREPQNALKTIFGSKTLIFQKCKDFHCKINSFEGWRVSSGAQNRPQEVPRGDKKAYRRSRGHRRQQEASKRSPSESQSESRFYF